MKTVIEFVLMFTITFIGIKYLFDMIRYAKGYEINGKCRFGKAYADALEDDFSEVPSISSSADEPSSSAFTPDFDQQYIMLSLLQRSA